MILAAQNISEQAPRLARRNREHAEAKIDDVYRTPIVELPPMPNRGRDRHLARS